MTNICLMYVKIDNNNNIFDFLNADLALVKLF